MLLKSLLLQLIECFWKARYCNWLNAFEKLYQCQELKQWTLKSNMNPYQNGRVLEKVVWNCWLNLQGQKGFWNVWKPYLKYHQLKVAAIKWRLIFLNLRKILSSNQTKNPPMNPSNKSNSRGLMLVFNEVETRVKGGKKNLKNNGIFFHTS
jgi:hypothetical protein